MSISLRNESGTLERVAGFSDVDSILSPTSKNPIMNKSVYNALALKIEKTVTDLVNYYDTSQVYNKTEVRELIGAINTLTIEVVNTLPSSDISSTTIYFVGPASGTNTYDEYVYVNNAWVKIGDTQIDLTDYVTSTALTTVLQSYYTKTAVDALLANYYTKTEANNLLDAKQDNLTFDDSPTTGSSNPVTSGGIKSAIDAIPSTNDVFKVMGVNGAKNYIPFPYNSSSSSMFTVNDDGSVLVNGTAGSSASRFFLTQFHGYYLKAGSYILSDGRANHSSSVYLQVYDANSPYTSRAMTSSRDNVAFTLAQDTEVVVQINVVANATANNDTFYPMLRHVFDIDSTYQPYAMTNKELTKELTNIEILYNENSTILTRIGGIYQLRFMGCNASQYATVVTDVGKYFPSSLFACLYTVTNDRNYLATFNASNRKVMVTGTYNADPVDFASTGHVLYGNMVWLRNKI